MGAARTAVAGPLTAPAGAEPAESSPAPRRRWWSIGVAVDWFFFVFAGLAAVWLAYLSLTETFHVGWWGIPFFAITLLAALQAIPRDLYEAASIDGAGPVQRFMSITLPMMANTLLFSSVIAIINAVQIFEPVALITQGGPVNATNVLTYHIRRVGIERAQGGLGSAMAVTLMLSLIVAITALFAFFRAREAKAA